MSTASLILFILAGMDFVAFLVFLITQKKIMKKWASQYTQKGAVEQRSCTEFLFLVSIFILVVLGIITL